LPTPNSCPTSARKAPSPSWFGHGSGSKAMASRSRGS
jgi:hypothetical protein